MHWPGHVSPYVSALEVHYLVGILLQSRYSKSTTVDPSSHNTERQGLERARDVLKRVRDRDRRSHSRSDESTVGTERSLGAAAGICMPAHAPALTCSVFIDWFMMSALW